MNLTELERVTRPLVEPAVLIGQEQVLRQALERFADRYDHQFSVWLLEKLAECRRKQAANP